MKLEEIKEGFGNLFNSVTEGWHHLPPQSDHGGGHGAGEQGGDKHAPSH